MIELLSTIALWCANVGTEREKADFRPTLQSQCQQRIIKCLDEVKQYDFDYCKTGKNKNKIEICAPAIRMNYQNEQKECFTKEK